MKRVTKGDLIAEPGYFYTPEEHQKNVERQKAIEDIKNFCAGNTTKVSESKPVGGKV